MFLLIDNYDSFTYNLWHYLGELGAEVVVKRNDRLTVDEALAMRPQGIVISPGPSDPDRAGICLELIRRAGDTPILGVCLGHQAIGQVFGGRVVRAPQPMHGKTSAMHHSGESVFTGLPNPLVATRYHSLIVERESLPDILAVTAETDDGLIMGLRHRERPIHGVQFHPESIASVGGHELLGNFLRLAAAEKTRRMTDMPDFKSLLGRVANGEKLSEAEAESAFEAMMSGNATPSQMGGFLMALRIRGESVEEITGAARVMRAKALHVQAPPGAIDTAGTGGDGSGTFNVSTAAAIVAAGAGVPVAKHGNRNLSSRCGSADVLAALGVNIDAEMGLIHRCMWEAGMGFLMAPRHHSATRHVGPTRVELGTRTIFNLLGPLSNPAGAKRQLAGVFAPHWVKPMAEVLGRLGAERALVVHGAGLDELTTTGTTNVASLENGIVTTFDVTPEEFGLQRVTVAALKGGDPADNAAMMRQVLGGAKGPVRDIVLLNGAAALVVGGKARDLRAGIDLAAATIDSGAAMAALDRMIAISNGGGV